jgi:uncharacterized protein Usg
MARIDSLSQDLWQTQLIHCPARSRRIAHHLIICEKKWKKYKKEAM